MNKRNLARASAKVETENRRGMTWPVYERHEIEYHNGYPVLVAPAPKLTPREIEFGVSCHYAPLRAPQLLLKLAALGDLLNVPEKMAKRGTHPLGEMYAFAGEYGLLGVSDPTGTRESLEEFTVAARNVSRALRLFEAARANDYDGDEDKLRALYRNTVAHGLPGVVPDNVAKYRGMIERARRDDLRERAWTEVSDVVSEHLAARTFPALYHLREKASGRTVRFELGDGFHDLLGAAYLLLSYAMMDPDVKTCKRDGCNRVIQFAVPDDTQGDSDEGGPKINPKTGEHYERGPYSTRSDKDFCNKACYRNWRYHNIDKPKKQAAR